MLLSKDSAEIPPEEFSSCPKQSIAVNKTGLKAHWIPTYSKIATCDIERVNMLQLLYQKRC